MAKIESLYPYEDYNVYTHFHKGKGRMYVTLKPSNAKERKNKSNKIMTYARYLMSTSIGRELTNTEEVDHIDNDKTNDVLSNLQILTPEENNIKQGLLKGHRMLILKCPYCGIMFEAEKRKSHVVPSVHRDFTACSQYCSLKFKSLVNNNPDSDIVKNGMANNIIGEYTKYKPIKILDFK